MTDISKFQCYILEVDVVLLLLIRMQNVFTLYTPLPQMSSILKASYVRFSPTWKEFNPCFENCLTTKKSIMLPAVLGKKNAHVLFYGVNTKWKLSTYMFSFR